jgi:ribonuclease R
MGRKRKNSGRRKEFKNSTFSLQNIILEFLNRNSGRAYSDKQLGRKLGFVGKKSKMPLIAALADLKHNKQVKELTGGKYTSIQKIESITGKVDYTNPRFGYVVNEKFEHDIWVSTRDLRSALHGDEVEVSITKAEEKYRRPEGRVLRIINRARKEYVGRIEISSKFAFVIPDSKKMHHDVFVHLGKIAKAKHNDKVIVKIVQWPGQRLDGDNPVGEVIEVLGPAGENDAEINSIMAEFGLPFKFSKKLEQLASEIPVKIDPKEIRKRKDFRKITTFTIDPEDAKDFDDALSFNDLGNGLIEVGIHIADVSHYLRPGSEIDIEAYQRATSIYLVDRTIPMLPEKLSNNLCSLRPNEEKLTFSAVFVIDKNAVVKKEWFGRTIICSDRRFTYEDAQEVIEKKTGDFKEEITTLNALAKILKQRRFEQGAINFETVEVKFDLDENGEPLGVISKVRKDAHKLIEEFMLLANRSVATFIFNRRQGKDTFVYRTHDKPDQEKLENFALFAKRFGHQINLKKGNISHILNQLMDEIEGKPEQNVLENLAIRSMAKAKYTTETEGHFGLAFEHYSHFTSPIRRYPDVMVHRLLQNYLESGGPAEKEEFEEKCLHSSEMEKKAADAERASIKYKQVQFMQGKEDTPFSGIVTGITEWGIFVEIIETRCEGMVRLADIEEDFYEFDEKNYRVVGRRNKKMITLGDEVRVMVKLADIDRRIIDLEFVEL